MVWGESGILLRHIQGFIQRGGGETPGYPPPPLTSPPPPLEFCHLVIYYNYVKCGDNEWEKYKVNLIPPLAENPV